jgi:predicted Zn-dependent protease
MIDEIVDALEARSDLKAWSVRHIQSRSAQQYDLQKSTEAKRMVESERYIVNVLRETQGPDGEPGCGAGNATILPGGNLQKALDDAAFMAGLVHNEPYHFPEPAPIPEVALADERLQADPLGTVEEILSLLKEAAAENPQVRLTAAECFGEENTTRLVNSRNIDASQVTTSAHLEWVTIAGEGDNEKESWVEFKRRRVADLNVKEELARRIQYTLELLNAESPKEYRGPVVVRNQTLASMLSPDTMLAANTLTLLSSANLKYTGETPWEIGKSVFRGEAKGDPLNLWANRRVPYGTFSTRFDKEGVPSQRVELIKDNELQTFIASKRFADYLDLPVTGAFGDIEISPGTTPAEELTRVPHVEVAEFSWFHPDGLSGDFACEIRLGYLVDGGERKPFKGGMLVGNLLDALADVHWSSETGFFGNYLGPTTARFNQLVVTGAA